MNNLTEYVKGLYNVSSCDDLTEFPKAERDKYYKTGNRQDFEKLYFRRRDFLSSCAFLAMSDDGYIPQLERIIISICDEYCWALPAHTPGTRASDNKVIDLFVSETSFALAEIVTVLGDRLSTEIKTRVKAEIHKRLVTNYENQSFWWEVCNMNWASVCSGFIGGTLIYLFPDEFEKHKQRLLDTMNSYIDGFSDSGVCPEGAEYWQYGFSVFTYFADLLYKLTNGEADLFASERVRKIAGYMETQLLTGGSVVSFSDADIEVKADMALQYYLSEKLPEAVSLLPEDRMSIRGGNTKWPCIYRTHLWVDNRSVKKERLKNHISENQLVIHKDGYSLAVKGGHNDEPHNHNDLGSFIFADKSGQVLCDLGAGRYTKDYFNENRYSIFCNSSLSHNVPVINGCGQSTGKQYSASLSYEENRIVADISNAYNIETPVSFIRSFELLDNSLVLTDKFEAGEVLSVTERFISLRKPVITDNAVILDTAEIIFDSEAVAVEINENIHIPHKYDAEPVTVYCIDFKLNDNANSFSVEIKGAVKNNSPASSRG